MAELLTKKTAEEGWTALNWRSLLIAQAEALEWVIEGTPHNDGPPPCRGYCERCDLEYQAARLRKEAE